MSITLVVIANTSRIGAANVALNSVASSGLVFIGWPRIGKCLQTCRLLTNSLRRQSWQPWGQYLTFQRSPSRAATGRHRTQTGRASASPGAMLLADRGYDDSRIAAHFRHAKIRSYTSAALEACNETAVARIYRDQEQEPRRLGNLLHAFPRHAARRQEPLDARIAHGRSQTANGDQSRRR